MDINFEELWTRIQPHALDLGLQLLAAVAILVIGRWIAKALTGAVRKLMRRAGVEETLQTFVGNLVYLILLTFVILATISQIGIQTTSIIAVLGAAGLAIGLALQGSLANFAAGVLIIVFKPYRVGDVIEAAGVIGTVEGLQIFTTTLLTADNKRVIIPNSQITDAVITNYSANETRRVDLIVGVSYSDDLDKVRTVLQEILAADERVLKEPEPLIAVGELADNSVNFVVRPWVRTADYWAVNFALTEAIKKRFDEAGISIPFPQRDVHLHTVSA